MGQNKTKSRAGRPKATTRTDDNFIRFCEADLYSRFNVEKARQYQKAAVGQGAQNWTIEQWDKILWTDKYVYAIFGSNKRVYVK